MEYLLMTEMMDPSFLDDEAPGVCWGQWASEGDQKSGKRKQPEDKTEQPPKMQRREQCGVSSNGWQQVDDLPDPLVVDLESSCGLSGLAVDSSYLSDVLSLPSLTVFKQELPSPSNHHDRGASACSPDSGNSPLGADGGHSPVPHPHQLVSSANNPEGETENYRNNKLLVTSEPATSTGSPPLDVTEDCRFQYVLAAATSIATKVNEETLTYLNQGQSYEIKLKKLGDLTVYRGKILKSVVKLCFHERRLQFMEQEQIAAWRASRPGDRIVEVDLPLSYGMYDLIQDPAMLNTVEFLWDPTKEVGVYIKVNCISTEFTPKKHGGEKGVPFRIQVETYLQHEKMCRHLHSASCQIKVFKLKGADRKHKQDRDKLLKRPECEREKYQPSYDCTVLSDVPITNECVFSSPLHLSPEPNNQRHRGFVSKRVGVAWSRNKNQVICRRSKFLNGRPHFRQNLQAMLIGALQTSNVKPQGSGDIQMIKTSHTPPMPALADRPQNNDTVQGGLVGSASPQQTMTWLQTNRFAAYLHTFASFSGADLMRLSRDDLIQICGLADGIRLFNALHPRAKTVYLCVQQSPVVYQAVYLATLSSREMCSKAAALVGLSLTQLSQVYMQGPNGIHVLVTDELVRNIKDEATFATELISDQSGEGLCLLLKPPPL